MKYVISVAKAYKHRGKHQHRTAKKHWFVYYYDEYGKLNIKQINLIQALFYKTKKLHRVKRICIECGRAGIFLVKSKKQKIICNDCV